ncbi:helix-turn-helix domain-containing protein, partial [Mycobacterium avium]|uniref:helix-turn-helix domain-containing protein n=1 Tax=Mycobacterium avium TaxID=1764 RepID=UPI0015E067E0
MANKADENFSCYPSIRTLMAESGAGRSTILRALSYLETRGLMSRRPQFHDSGARRSTRYYLNHPRAPHVLPGPDPGPPRPAAGQGSSRSETETVTKPHLPGGPQRDPLDPATVSLSEPGDAAILVLECVARAWKLGTHGARSLR